MNDQGVGPSHTHSEKAALGIGDVASRVGLRPGSEPHMIFHCLSLNVPAAVFADVLGFPFSPLSPGQKNSQLCSVLLMSVVLKVAMGTSFVGVFMPEKVDPKIRAAIEADPIAVFNKFADMRLQGQDPVELGILPANPVTKKVKSPDRWAKQQVDSAVASGDAWLDGVKNPSRDPISAALAANQKRIDRLTESIKTKKWEKNLAKSSHAEIVKIAEAVGTGAYTGGVSARADKIKRVISELHPLVQAASDTIQAMDQDTDAQREKRLLTARKLMIEVGKKRAGA